MKKLLYIFCAISMFSAALTCVKEGYFNINEFVIISLILISLVLMIIYKFYKKNKKKKLLDKICLGGMLISLLLIFVVKFFNISTEIETIVFFSCIILAVFIFVVEKSQRS